MGGVRGARSTLQYLEQGTIPQIADLHSQKGRRTLSWRTEGHSGLSVAGCYVETRHAKLDLYCLVLYCLVLSCIMSVLKCIDSYWYSGNANPKPAWRSAHPILDNLGAKLVHFLVDYHHDWFSSLELEKSDGKHKQLDGVEVQDVLDRLETIPEAHGEVQIFKVLQIAHYKFHGAQNVYSAPFQSGGNQPRMVCIYLYCFG